MDKIVHAFFFSFATFLPGFFSKTFLLRLNQSGNIIILLLHFTAVFTVIITVIIINMA